MDAQLNCASVWRGFYSVYKFPNGHRFQKTMACGFLPQGAGRQLFPLCPSEIATMQTAFWGRRPFPAKQDGAGDTPTLHCIQQAETPFSGRAASSGHTAMQRHALRVRFSVNPKGATGYQNITYRKYTNAQCVPPRRYQIHGSPLSKNCPTIRFLKIAVYRRRLGTTWVCGEPPVNRFFEKTTMLCRVLFKPYTASSNRSTAFKINMGIAPSL